jgi:hypothetical protein
MFPGPGLPLQKDVPLVTPSPAIANNPFREWPGGWPWRGWFNVDVYFGGSQMAAMGRLIAIGRALAADGSTTAAAAADKVAAALKLLLQRRLTLPCTFAPASGGGANPGSLCWDPVFKVVTTSRAQSVSH